MNEISQKQIQMIELLLPGSYHLQSVPLNTDIICTNGKKEIPISHFSSYIGRDLLLKEKIIPAQCTVLCWDDGKRTPRVVPSVIIERNGKLYARAYSYSNSIYTLVTGSRIFTDVQKNTAQSDIELLASKMILAGKSSQKYDPSGVVTRAELAAMLVRALGLKELNNLDVCFKDVSGKEWFAGSVAAAAKANLICGMPDGSFQPQNNVNRQEAMVMLTKALQAAGKNYENIAEENEMLISGFRDYQNIADWAQPAVAAAVKNGLIQGEGAFDARHQLNRAEAAALLAALLRSAGLIDERSTLSDAETGIDSPSSTSSSGINEDDKGILVLEGSALTQKKLFSLDDLKAMTDIVVNANYFSRGKVKDGWAAEQHDGFTGVSLYKLLMNKIGLSRQPMGIKVIGNDGYTKIFSLEETTGLYIDETNPDARLEMIIAWSRNGNEFKYESTQPFRIVFGQKYQGDYNRQNWVNYVKKILVY